MANAKLGAIIGWEFWSWQFLWNLSQSYLLFVHYTFLYGKCDQQHSPILSMCIAATYYSIVWKIFRITYQRIAYLLMITIVSNLNHVQFFYLLEILHEHFINMKGRDILGDLLGDNLWLPLVEQPTLFSIIRRWSEDCSLTAG